MKFDIPIKSSVKFNVYFTAFVILFLMIAITNLIDGIAIVASILYLLLVFVPSFIILKDAGVKMFCILLLKNYSSHFFIEMFDKENENAQIRFGFDFFKYEFFYKTIFLKDKLLIESSMGQASHKLGRDVNDWLTFIYYNHNDLIKSERRKNLKYPDKNICVAGESGIKKNAFLFQQKLVDYLNSSKFYSVESIEMKEKDEFSKN